VRFVVQPGQAHGQPSHQLDHQSSHQQGDYQLRFDWGLSGALAIAGDADVAVVVDVLSFSTAVSVAVDYGIEVFPYLWGDLEAEEFAAERGAILATKRGVTAPNRSAKESGQQAEKPSDKQVVVGLSPASIRAARGVQSLVLPSPNGSSICYELAQRGSTVVAACLRNAPTVAAWLGAVAADGAVIAVIAAGERWPDGTLRPAWEDAWGAGAVISSLRTKLGGRMSPEALAAAHAFDSVHPALSSQLVACASGRELVARGYRRDVEIAAEYDGTTAVPLLKGESFTVR
jgi:2-phosphosulfolactate phosphatase